MMEITYLGPKVVAIRLAVKYFFSLLSGRLSALVWQKLNV